MNKIALLQNASALIFPSLWHEAFGLVMIEALACGTPVVAYDKGAAREILVENRTGFLATNISDLEHKVKEIDRLDREFCRHSAVENFDYRIMAKAYYEIVQAVIQSKRKLEEENSA